jgi:hypothetical protein
MRRPLTASLLTVLALAACTEEPTSPSTSAVLDTDAAQDRAAHFDNGANATDIAVIGDVPYGDDALAAFPTLVAAINADPKVRVAVHIGDIKSGSTECSDAWYVEMAHQFEGFNDPLVYSIGDNEWTDCHRASNGAYDPIDRLTKLREIFFADPGQALGGRPMSVAYEHDHPEDQLWVDSRVTFATFHEIGSNNGLAEWFGGAETPAQTAAREAEYASRAAANVAWLERTFETARHQGSPGIVLFLHADLWHPDDRADGEVFDGHQDFVARLAELAPTFDGPVLIISGDSHDYRVDPGVPWVALYGLTPPANVTQIIVDRSIEDDIDWLRLHVDPKSPEVFTWEQVFVN